MYAFKIKIFYEVIKMNENIMNALNAIEDERADSTADVMIAMESYTGKTDEFNEFTESEMVMESQYSKVQKHDSYLKKIGNFVIIRPDEDMARPNGDISVVYVDPRADGEDFGLSKGMVIFGPKTRKEKNAECAIHDDPNDEKKIKNMALTELFPYVKKKYGLNKKDEEDFRAIVAYARKHVNKPGYEKELEKFNKDKDDAYEQEKNKRTDPYGIKERSNHSNQIKEA
jgi:hypothetical protein